MEDRSRVIRDISRLKLRPNAQQLAYSLAEQIEMPVAFIVDAPGDYNYFGRHPEQPNAFWCSIKPQTEQTELERLVLGNLYHGIQDGKRYLCVYPCHDYLTTLGIKQRESYLHLLGKINSLMFSLDSECFLCGYGIVTHWEVHEKKFDDCIQKLHEYIKMRKIQPAYRWYLETEICNLIDYGNYCRRGKAFRDRLLPIVRQINPRYIPIIHKVEKIILDAKKQYSIKTADKVAEKVLKKLVKLFHLESMVVLDRPLAYREALPQKLGGVQHIFSFIPEDYDRHDVLVKGIREANFFLSLVQEAYDFRMPIAFVYLSQNDFCNAYSNEGADDSYIISYTTSLFYTIYDLICGGQYDLLLPENMQSEKERKQYVEKFFRFVIFFITAHEYGHILNGDCGHQASSSDRAAKEAAADETAERLLEWCFIMQYRPDESETVDAPHRLSEDEFMNWFYELSPQGKLDYWRNSVQFRRQLSGDYQILKKAIQFSKGYLRQRILSM